MSCGTVGEMCSVLGEQTAPNKICARDPALANELLAIAEELCERAYGGRPVHYAHDVHARLAFGDERFGDEYLTRDDNLAEALEETPDAIIYMLLELDKLRGTIRDEDWQELRMDTLAAMALGAAFHEAIARLRHKRNELT